MVQNPHVIAKTRTSCRPTHDRRSGGTIGLHQFPTPLTRVFDGGLGTSVRETFGHFGDLGRSIAANQNIQKDTTRDLVRAGLGWSGRP